MRLSREKWRWMSERNVDSLAALFHEEAVFVHMGGTMSRDQELGVIRSGGIHYKHAEIQKASVRFVGTTAIVLNTIRLVAVVGGNEVVNPFEVTEVYVPQGGAWKLASLSFTRLLTRPQPQNRAQVTINDTAVAAENLTSSRDGTVYFGSMGKGTIYRAAPGAAQAEPWILASTAGLTNVLGVLAEDKTNTLWVCQNATFAGDGAPSIGQTALRSFDLRSGVPKGTYPFPPNSGVCNDIALSADGSAYVSESFRGRVHRLKPGATQLEVWVTDPTFEVIDGLAFLADGSLYVNDFRSGRLFRVPVNADGSAGPVVPIETSMPLVRPDGLRTVGPRSLIQAEGQGRVSELTISGNRAEVRVLRDGLTAATGVTLVGDSALVLVERTRAVLVPYRPR